MSKDTEPSYVLASGAVYVALCPLFVGLRFYARHLQHVRPGADDWLLLAALLTGLGCAITVIIGVNDHSFAYPSPPAGTVENAENYTRDEKLQAAFYPLQVLCIGFVKLSFMFFFRRVFVVNKHTTRNWVSIAIIVICALWTAAFFIMLEVDCPGNYAARWTSPAVFKQYCVYDLGTLLGLAISDPLTDLLVLSFPIFPIIRLHTSAGRKLAILGVFAVGMAALVASILRLVFVDTVINGDAKQLSKNSHDNLLATKAIYWSMVQCSLAVIACCLPTFHHLLISGPIRAVQSGFQSIYSRASFNSLRHKAALQGEASMDEEQAGQRLANNGGRNETTVISLSDIGRQVRHIDPNDHSIHVENGLQQESRVV